MAHDFTQIQRVEFSDTDAAGLAHFTAFFRWMEITEHAFYRSLGGTAFGRTEEGDFGVPRVSASCDFVSPVSYGDEVAVHLEVAEKTSRKLSYRFEFRTHPGGAAVARGEMTVVSALRPSGAEAFKAVELPEPLGRAIEVAE